MRRILSLLVAALATAPALAAVAEPPAIFAVIVTNNRSGTLNRPDLQYADDDGAHYHALFRGVAAPEAVQLLTTFDRQSAAIYPELAAAARAPTRAALRAAIDQARAGIEVARGAGRATSFYFVFAGHGDVVDGKGILDLADGPVDGQFIEAEVVNRIPADSQHLVLDSCNSFFVFNPRRPGGRRWATPRDMALGFAARHPNVGLLLSTNSEAEVYEWSELESGIFSYEVRSGLTGAADVDGDGRVSYAELAGFIETANRRIPRETFRPRIYWRGPGGDGGAALFPWARLEGKRVVLDGGDQRLWIRGGDGGRLADIHKEAGRLTVVIPGAADQPLTVVEQRAPDAGGGRPTTHEYGVASGQTSVLLFALQPAPAAGTAARGGAEIFRQLFVDAWGPRAYSQFKAVQADVSEPVYGISQNDAARMRNYLAMMAEFDRSGRRLGGATYIFVGGLFGTMGAVSYYDFQHNHLGSPLVPTLVFGIIGAGFAAGGIWMATSTSAAEQALQSFDLQLRSPAVDWQAVIAGTERRLEDVAAHERRRRGQLVIASVLAAGTIAWYTANGDVARFTQLRAPYANTFGYGFALGQLLIGAYWYRMETPQERFLKLYHQDPALRVHVDVAAAPGGGIVGGVSGRF